MRAVDDGSALARAAEAGPGWPGILRAGGLGWDYGKGEIALDLPGLDGIGPRLVAMAGTISQATRTDCGAAA